MDINKLTCDDDWKYGRTALRQGLPWITVESFKHLTRLVQPEWRVFEWGSGGSTVYWARECQECISIEHNPEWIKRTAEMLQQAGVTADLRYVGAELGKGPDAFRKYADAILSFPDAYFDCVYVDGEASSRGWCISNGLPKLKPGGIFLADNSDWIPDGLYMNWERFNYVEHGLTWVGQAGTFDWWTSIFVKPCE